MSRLNIRCILSNRARWCLSHTVMVMGQELSSLWPEQVGWERNESLETLDIKKKIETYILKIWFISFFVYRVFSFLPIIEAVAESMASNMWSWCIRQGIRHHKDFPKKRRRLRNSTHLRYILEGCRSHPVYFLKKIQIL